MTRLLLLAFCLACGGAQVTQTTIADVDAPEPVRAELTRIFGPVAALEVERETDDDGEEEWESTIAVPMEIEQDASGAITKVEFLVPFAMAPEAVREAAAAQWPGATLTQAEVVVEGDTLLWEIEGEDAAGEELEGYFRPDGSLRDAAPEPAAEPVSEPAVESPLEPTAESGSETAPEPS
ncbi:MAG: hypothetical protein AAGE52_31820 [Myxococcota bacterium]